MLRDVKSKSFATLVLGLVICLCGVGGFVYALVNAPDLPQAYLIPIFLIILPIVAIFVYFFHSRRRN